MGVEGVWVHNAAGRECQQIFSIYHRFRARQGNSVEDAFRLLEQKIKVFVKKADDTPKLMGKAIDDVIKKEIYPDLPLDSIWTNGPCSSGGANIWDHYRKHVYEKLHFPDIDNAITYAKRAVEFTNQSPGGSVVVWTRPGNGRYYRGATEMVWCNTSTREFAVKVISNHAEAGKIKTFMKVDNTNSLWKYMYDNGWRP